MRGRTSACGRRWRGGRALGTSRRCRRHPHAPPSFSRSLLPPPAALAIDEDAKKGLFVAGFAGALYKNVELSVGTVLSVSDSAGRGGGVSPARRARRPNRLPPPCRPPPPLALPPSTQWFSYLVVAAAVAKIALGVGGATGDVGGLVAPTALAVASLSLYDVGTTVVCLFGVLTAQALGLGAAGTWAAIATLAGAAYKGYASQWLTAAIAAVSAKALYESGFKVDKAGAANAAILAATAYVVAKDLYGPWVTVGALHATAMAAINLVSTVVDRLT